MDNIIAKIGGQNISSQINRLYIDQSVGKHHQFEFAIGSEDRSAYFIGNLSENSKKWMGQPFEIDGLFKGVVTSVSLSRTRSGGSEFLISGRSPTIHLDDGIHARSFGEKNLQQIVDDVLKPYGSKFEETDINPNYTEQMEILCAVSGKSICFY